METVHTLIEPFRLMLLQIVAFLPRLAVALVIVAIGWVLAKMAKLALVKALRAVNFNVLTERAGLDGFLRQGGIETDTSAIFGLLAFWMVVLGALVAAFNAMNFPYVSDFLSRAVFYIPRLAVALLIATLGAYFARFVANAVATYCRQLEIPDADMLGSLAQYAILIFVILIAFDHTGIGGDLMRESFLIVLAGMVFALALAFGLGGRRAAARVLDRWWPDRNREGR
jgi:hypothetical protein